MSDNEAEQSGPEQSESENEVSINEEDLIEENISEAESSSDDEKKEKPKKEPVKKEKPKKEDDEDELEEIEGEEEEDYEEEIDFGYLDRADSLSQKTGIIIDPRQLNPYAKSGHKIKREIIVSRDKYKSSEYLQLPEFCDLIGVRAEHISQGADIYVELEAETTAREIAKKELQRGKCPFLIKRYMTPMQFDPVYVEIWNPNDMAINPKFFNN
jgi:hypothetical protein